jgi:sulfur-oxidizing protein SoxZ
MMATARTLINIPVARSGEIIEIRATLGHPMETGHRPDGQGQLVPRSIVTRFECRLDGERVFGMDLSPAVAANPYIAFTLRAQRSGTLIFVWEGDHGFRHSESRPLVLA